MIASFTLFLSLASAMSAPTTPKDEALRALINPTPEMLKQLNQLSAPLKAISSLAAAYPELTTEARLANQQPANLNLLGGLNGLVTRLVTSLIDRLLPGSSSQPTPTNPGGTGTGSGTFPNGGANPQVPVGTMPNPFNPFSSLFSGGSNPFSMFLSPMMFGNMFEGFMEIF